MSASPKDRNLDPLLLAVLSNRLEAICREMTNTLLRSGRSAVLNTARDFSCAIVTRDNELLASAEGLPVHVIGMEFLTEAMAELHDDIRPGDAFLHNDPYLGNTHSADQTILVPVFIGDRHVLTACAKAHQADIGNSIPTTYMPGARDIYEEGALVFPCVRVQRDFEDVADIIRMCRRRIRVPDQWYGDYLAALGAARIAERRLSELFGQYGVDTLDAFIVDWFDYSERRMIDALSKLPDATLTGSGRHDPYPGLDEGIPLKVTIEIKPREGRVRLDLTDNPDNYPGGLNESRACATNNVVAGLFNSIDPEVPHNSGSFRRVDVQLRTGSVAGIPEFPHSCSMATTNVADRLISITQAAFAELGDGYGLAEGAMGMGPCYAVVSGQDARAEGEPFVNQLFVGAAGGPGGPSSDGWPTYMIPVVASLLYVDSVEVDEQKYPILVHQRQLIADSEGPGRFRGAPGCLVSYAPLAGPLTAAYTVEAHFNPPQGVRGGGAGAPADAWKTGADGERAAVPKADAIVLEPGETLFSVTAGGGGYGSPLEREPALVLEDFREGLISRERAADVYGVVIGGGAEDAVDEEATRRRRMA
jgi:N-methylhydantoinase B